MAAEGVLVYSPQELAEGAERTSLASGERAQGWSEVVTRAWVRHQLVALIVDPSEVVESRPEAGW